MINDVLGLGLGLPTLIYECNSSKPKINHLLIIDREFVAFGLLSQYTL